MGASEPRVLVIEDDSALRRVLETALTAEGDRVHEAATGRRGIEQAAEHKPDVIVLDLRLPDLDGMLVLRRLREWSHAAIIVVSARTSESDKVGALDGGADDFTKPFSMSELLARLRVARRHFARARGDGEPAIVVGELCVDLARREVFVRDRKVHCRRRSTRSSSR